MLSIFRFLHNKSCPIIGELTPRSLIYTCINLSNSILIFLAVFLNFSLTKNTNLLLLYALVKYYCLLFVADFGDIVYGCWDRFGSGERSVKTSKGTTHRYLFSVYLYAIGLYFIIFVISTKCYCILLPKWYQNTLLFLKLLFIHSIP